MRIKTILTIAAFISMASINDGYCETYYDTTPSEYCIQGQKYYKSGQYSSAVNEYKKALRENPNDESARIGLINSYVGRAEYYNNTEKNTKKALNDIKSVIFYFECFTNSSQGMSTQAYKSALENLAVLESSLNADTSYQGLMNSADNLRKVQWEFAAAGYDFYRALGKDENSVEANIGFADILKLLKKPQKASVYYERALKTNPSDAEIRMKLARALEESGEYGKAADNYNIALQNSSQKEEILTSLEKICRQRVEQNPSDGEAHCNLGTIYQKRGNIEGAIAEYAKAEKLSPSLITTKVNLAILYFEQKKYKEAIEASNKALLTDPKNIQARLQKAKSFQAMSSWENAVNEYKEILKTDENNSDAIYGLAEIYTKNKPDKDAIETLKEDGIKLSPDFYTEMAYKAHKLKELDKAIKYYNLAIKEGSSDKSVYINLSQIYSEQNNFQSAIQCIEQAKTKFPSDEAVEKQYKAIQANFTNNQYAEAENYYKQEEYQKAIAKYEEINPQNYDTSVGIAAAYQNLKEYDKATEYYKKALEYKPDTETVQIALAGMYIQTDKLTEAEDVLNKIKNSENQQVKELKRYIAEQNSTSAIQEALAKFDAKDYNKAEEILTGLIQQKTGGYLPYYYRAMVYDAQKKYTQAVNDYEAVIAKDSGIALVYYSLGVDYDSLKNYTRAVQNYKKFLELTKDDNEYTKYARQRIKEAK